MSQRKQEQPTTSSEERDDYDRVKHLEMIQSVVARLANEAALIRGWALTISSAFFGFAAQSSSWRVATVGLLPVVAFWGLNSYYLRAERQYRKLYDRVRTRESNEPFDMNAHGEKVQSWLRTNFSLTLFPFYGVILLVGVILIIAGALTSNAPATTYGDNYFLDQSASSTNILRDSL